MRPAAIMTGARLCESPNYCAMQRFYATLMPDMSGPEVKAVAVMHLHFLRRHLAAAEGQFVTVEWLVTREHCNPSPVDRFGRTPLEVGCCVHLSAACSQVGVIVNVHASTAVLTHTCAAQLPCCSVPCWASTPTSRSCS